MPPYIEDICYKLYALASELVKKCVVPFCCIVVVIIATLIIFGLIKKKNNQF